jgi:hypothetical protein
MQQRVEVMTAVNVYGRRPFASDTSSSHIRSVIHVFALKVRRLIKVASYVSQFNFVDSITQIVLHSACFFSFDAIQSVHRNMKVSSYL